MQKSFRNLEILQKMPSDIVLKLQRKFGIGIKKSISNSLNGFTNLLNGNTMHFLFISKLRNHSFIIHFRAVVLKISNFEDFLHMNRCWSSKNIGFSKQRTASQIYLIIFNFPFVYEPDIY